MGTGNPYKKNNGKFGSAQDHDYLLYEPNKDRNIKQHSQEAFDRNTDGIANPLPMASELDKMQIDYYLKEDGVDIAYAGKLKEVEISSLKTLQPRLFSSSHDTFEDPKDDAPIVINLQGKTNVVIDGNHRIYQAMKDGKKTIKVHYTSHIDYIFRRKK